MLLRWMFAYNLELCKEKNDKLSSFSFHNIVNVFQPPAKVLNAIHDFQFDYQCILNDAILSFLKRYGFSFFFPITDVLNFLNVAQCMMDFL